MLVPRIGNTRRKRPVAVLDNAQGVAHKYATLSSQAMPAVTTASTTVRSSPRKTALTSVKAEWIRRGSRHLARLARLVRRPVSVGRHALRRRRRLKLALALTLALGLSCVCGNMASSSGASRYVHWEDAGSDIQTSTVRGTLPSQFASRHVLGKVWWAASSMEGSRGTRCHVELRPPPYYRYSTLAFRSHVNLPLIYPASTQTSSGILRCLKFVNRGPIPALGKKNQTFRHNAPISTWSPNMTWAGLVPNTEDPIFINVSACAPFITLSRDRRVAQPRFSSHHRFKSRSLHAPSLTVTHQETGNKARLTRIHIF
ncbi:hypothetical protein B0I35DRAFT_227552 [Stachybotrys elegans]|uniref:Uncharacterized protein n=1 Tax=Stachybotrys elegans TaxID=80388 RepID=A0A8K0SRN9_9HYPO|nr:hypothetical protein B0I35DRAFT_227552 [Stachybotrys elegans]